MMHGKCIEKTDGPLVEANLEGKGTNPPRIQRLRGVDVENGFWSLPLCNDGER
jgi:hypothetical protein